MMVSRVKVGNSNGGKICLANARLVLPDRIVCGAVHVSNGVITTIDDKKGVPQGAVDCDGDLVLPGLVELHTDNLERHIEPRPDVAWPLASAILAHDGELASTGITTVFDAIRVGSIPGSRHYGGPYARALANELAALRSAKALRISHFLHLRAEICSETLLSELAEFDAADQVGIVSLMDHTPGQRQFRDLDKMRAYVSGRRHLGRKEFDEHVRLLYRLRARFGEKHETGAVEAAHCLGAVLASHDDTSAEHVIQSAQYGIRLAEFPTTMAAAQTCREQGIAILAGAPNMIRGESHSGNVSAVELAGDGLLDILSSDYVPSALLLGVFRLARLWDDLPRAVATASTAPATATRLNDRGALALGQRGDVLRVRLHDGTPVIRGVWNHGHRVA